MKEVDRYVNGTQRPDLKVEILPTLLALGILLVGVITILIGALLFNAWITVTIARWMDWI